MLTAQLSNLQAHFQLQTKQATQLSSDQLGHPPDRKAHPAHDKDQAAHLPDPLTQLARDKGQLAHQSDPLAQLAVDRDQPAHVRDPSVHLVAERAHQVQVQDVLNYFSTHGLPAKNKLFFGCLQPGLRHDDTDRSPYDLAIVSKDELNKQYHTISVCGVVEVFGDGTSSHYTSFGDYTRAISMHQVFSGLKSFRHVWVSSTFTKWLMNARQSRFHRMRQQIAQRLLLLKPSYRSALMEARGKLEQLADIGAMSDLPNGNYKIDAFVKQQTESQRSKLSAALARQINAVISIAQTLGAQLAKSECNLKKEVDAYDSDPSAGAMKGLNPIKIQAERTAKRACHHQVYQDLQVLPNFVRLLDCLVMQTHLDLVTAAAQALKDHLENPGRHVLVEICLGREGVTFRPSQEDLLRAISKTLMESLVGVLKEAPRPLEDPTLSPLLHQEELTGCTITVNPALVRSTSLSGSGANSSLNTSRAVAAIAAKYKGSISIPYRISQTDQSQTQNHGQLTLMVVGDMKLAGIRRACDQLVMRSYREAQKVAETLQELHVLFKFARSFDAAEYKSRTQSIAQLRKDTQLLREWQAQLQTVVASQVSGVLQLETDYLKTTYLRTLQLAQAAVAMKAVACARKECGRVIGQLQQLTSELTAQPTKLEEFLIFFLHCQAMRIEKDLQMAAVLKVQDMYGMVSGWGHRLPYNDQVLLDDLKEASRGFSAALSAANGFIDSRRAGMMALLDRQAKDLLKQVQDLLRSIELGSMQQRLSPNRLILSNEQLASWDACCKNLAVSTTRVNLQESQLGVKATFYTDLAEAVRELGELRAACNQLGLNQ
eukprot:jgi/Chrzof1/3728/Cz13g06230.t1